MSAPPSSESPTKFPGLDVRRVINAAGKLTALGGSAQRQAVADAQARAARAHVDLGELRRAAGHRVAEITGAEAASITTGAAAGIAIGVAACITGTDIQRIRRIPDTAGLSNHVVLQAGHDVDFGAPVVQMIRVGGGVPVLVGTRDAVTETELDAALRATPAPAALLYVQSHHCIQERRVPLEVCVQRAHAAGVDVIVDAAAEEDLSSYVARGADLVTYSGGKAIGGPTCGFIAGRAPLIEACEQQQRGIARAMKVGKEQIAGLIAALDAYDSANAKRHDAAVVAALLAGLRGVPNLDVFVRADEAGRPIERVAVRHHGGVDAMKRLVKFLEHAEPSIRTRNHQLKNGFIQLDPREIELGDAAVVTRTIAAFAARDTIQGDTP
jgi:D-glucosaminate-6-phosphate ammonia-lyase